MIRLSGLQAIALAFMSLTTCSDAQAGLKQIEPGPASGIVIYGTQPGGLAADCADAACKSGPVSPAIASALKKPDITIAGFFDAVRAGVMTATARAQIPYVEAFDAIDVPLRNPSGRSLALVIGNGAYAHFPRLQGSPHDAEIVGKSLQDSGFDTTTLADLDYAAFKKAITDFLLRTGPDDTVVFYYSGHGFSQPRDTAYVPAVDADLPNTSPVQLSIEVKALIDEFSRSRAARKILIFDTHFPPISPPR